jgi:hypothetical protein
MDQRNVLLFVPKHALSQQSLLDICQLALMSGTAASNKRTVLNITHESMANFCQSAINKHC